MPGYLFKPPLGLFRKLEDSLPTRKDLPAGVPRGRQHHSDSPADDPHRAVPLLQRQGEDQLPWWRGSATGRACVSSKTVLSVVGLALKKIYIYLILVSDRPCQFMCDPNYFMSLGKKTKTHFLNYFGKNEKRKKTENTNSAYNMLGVSIAAVKKCPTYHSLPLEK